MVEPRPVAAIVLAAGLGTRMRSARAKVLHHLGGRPLLEWPLAALGKLGARPVVVVVGHQADEVGAVARATGLARLETVLQAEQRGTGHAVRCAVEALRGFDGDVLVLYGDVPLIRAATLRALVDAHRAGGSGLSLLTVRFDDPTGYGRIVRDAEGRVIGIVEERDASPAERKITELNPGFYCVRASILVPLLAELRADNAQGEYYLTDLVGLAAQRGVPIVTLPVEGPAEVAGINTRTELAHMEALVRSEQVARWLAEGVTFEDPQTAYVGPDVTIGRDSVIGPNVVLRGRTRIGEGCRLDGNAFLVDTTLGERVHLRFACVAEGAQVGDDAIVGPFARLRPGTRLGPRVHIGNFVETKQAVLGAGTKANHLTYLGDCEIGADTNVGAGTITCNYDGFTKSRTTIGARVQIGSDTQLIAPVSVGDDSYVGAGTTVTKNVPPWALAVSRTPMEVVPGWVARKRARASGAVAPAAPTAKTRPRRRPPARAAKPAGARATARGRKR
jgi:bifunctional UDP-N-acetylglucosamine pyrophosphorylase/glucosamine-1-phosphate N-acetyltransferase